MIRKRSTTAVATPQSMCGLCVAITGAGNGIGRALAEQFARLGAHVVIGDIDEQAARTAAAEIGSPALGLALDVSDDISFARFLDTAENAFGPLAILINNAGVDWMGDFHTETTAVSKRQLEVNLLGQIIGTRLALQHMLPRHRGHLVNIASAAGRVPQPGSSVYTATKFGVVGLTEALRLEYRGSGVNFTLVHPGQVQTQMLDGTARPSRLLPVITPDVVATAVVDAVLNNRFEVWTPSNTRVGVTLGHLTPRPVREWVLLKLGVGEIAGQTDSSARKNYHDRMFGTVAEQPRPTRGPHSASASK